jgi:type I restriction enzyme R subunit
VPPRSIYNVWRQVLEYFDAFLIELPATPSKQTFGFFNQNLVMEYNHERAVADGVNVGYDVYRIKTEIGEQGGKVAAGFYVDYRDKATREIRWSQLEDTLEYTAQDLDRSVVVRDQIRTVVRAYKERLFTDLFPGRSVVPKTLIFAKDDSHAEDIMEIVREEFGRGNEFCKKITYRASEKSETLISEFRTSPILRIAVTVDMISTGTDVRPLERRPTVAFDNLLLRVAFGSCNPDTLTTLASRLSRLDRQIDERDRQAIRDTSGGKNPSDLANALLDAVDPDRVRKHAAEENATDSPTEVQIQEAASALAERACEPFDSPELRNTLTSLKRRSEQVIDRVSEDRVIYAGYDYDKARQMVTTFEEFIEKNRDDLTALQIIYNRPYSERHLTLEAIRQLADALDDPPYLLDSEALWKAYERLESARSHLVCDPTPESMTHAPFWVANIRFAALTVTSRPRPRLMQRRLA